MKIVAILLPILALSCNSCGGANSNTNAPAENKTSDPVPVAPKHSHIYAHRGASMDSPENTISSIKLAMEQGADGVEFDVRVSKDGHVVLMHDETTKRIGGVDKKVSDQTLEELRQLDVGEWFDAKFKGERIATLSEALAAVDDGKYALVEIKSKADSVDTIATALKAIPDFEAKARIISFDQEVCAKSRAALPTIPVYLVVSGLKKEGTEEFVPYHDGYLTAVTGPKLTGLVPDLRSLSDDFVAKAKEKNVKIIAWTANEPELVRKLDQWGIEGIETDAPAMAVKALQE
jgi:glycerophosphoryl diester phosphodiesterase